MNARRERKNDEGNVWWEMLYDRSTNAEFYPWDSQYFSSSFLFSPNSLYEKHTRAHSVD